MISFKNLQIITIFILIRWTQTSLVNEALDSIDRTVIYGMHSLVITRVPIGIIIVTIETQYYYLTAE